MFGPDGLIVLAVVLVVLLFGGAQLPKLARGLGSASRELKNASSELKKELDHKDGADAVRH